MKMNIQIMQLKELKKKKILCIMNKLLKADIIKEYIIYQKKCKE